MERLHSLYLLFFLSCVLPAYTNGQEKAPCAEEVHELVKPFMGVWQEFTITEDGEEFMGTLRSSSAPDGCTIEQRFVSADGSFSYRSFGYVESASNRWKEIYIFSNGSNSEFQWFKDAGNVVMRRTGGSRHMDYIHQLRLKNVSFESYDVVEEHSFDFGKSWKKIELTRIKRIASDQNDQEKE